jgi:hypothetical protein
MAERKALVDRFKGRSIHTVWGPSVVKRMSDDCDTVVLYEFGEQRFDLSYSDFVNELKEQGHL